MDIMYMEEKKGIASETFGCIRVSETRAESLAEMIEQMEGAYEINKDIKEYSWDWIISRYFLNKGTLKRHNSREIIKIF